MAQKAGSKEIKYRMMMMVQKAGSMEIETNTSGGGGRVAAVLRAAFLSWGGRGGSSRLAPLVVPV